MIKNSLIYKPECLCFLHNHIRLSDTYVDVLRKVFLPCFRVQGSFPCESLFPSFSTRGRVGSASTYSFKLNSGDGDVRRI